MKSYSEIKEILIKYGQEHLLGFWDRLDEAGKNNLLSQLDAIDFDEMRRLIGEYVLRRPETALPDDLAPAGWFPRRPAPENADLYRRAEARGRELLAAGKVAFLTVAGGQGTRLGYNAPKGTYPIGPLTGRSLFGYFAGTIKKVSQKYGCSPVWYVMTSAINRADTEAFFEKENFFGLERNRVFFFTQGSMPAVGLDGKLLLAREDSLALSPNGHGGTLLALRKSGALDRMKADSAEVISYFQVDNPLAPMADPLFIGLHDLEKSEMSAIVLIKTGPMEKLGNFCVSGGRTQIIEYSDLPEDLANRRKADGSLFFAAGSPAIHMISRKFVEDLTAGGSLRLPWHRADKKVPCLDASGSLIQPSVPNAVKLESFIFDALPLAGKTMLLEGERAFCFAPTKNATGVDSVESCRAMLLARDAAWLEEAGVKVERTADGTAAGQAEISPELAVEPADLREVVASRGLKTLSAGDRITLD